jgi:hypothetical protein
MVVVKRLILDVLKPHQPNALEFSRTVAEVGSGYRVRLVVIEVDEHTESLRVEIDGHDLDFQGIEKAIVSMGGSLHSIDEVDVVNQSDDSGKVE